MTDPRSVADQAVDAKVARLAFDAFQGGELVGSVIRTRPTERFGFPFGAGPRGLCQSFAGHSWDGRLVAGGRGLAVCDRCAARISVGL